MGDNTDSLAGGKTIDEVPNPSPFSQSKPGDPWHLTFQQLLILTTRMDKMDDRMNKLDSIDNSTSKLASELGRVAGKVEDIEREVISNAKKIQGVEKEMSTFKNSAEEDLKGHNDKILGLEGEVASLRAIIEKQGKELASLKQLKKQFRESSREMVEETSREYFEKAQKQIQDASKEIVEDSSQKYTRNEYTDSTTESTNRLFSGDYGHYPKRFGEGG